MQVDTHFESEYYADYIDWRETHPSDDLMTALLAVEFEDEDGTTRRLTRDEVLMYVTLLSGAGNDTTAKLIGWTGKVLSDNPDERTAARRGPDVDPGRGRGASRATNRPACRTPGTPSKTSSSRAAWSPLGSPVVCVIASANHDERRFPDPERFDVRRKPAGHHDVRLRLALLPRRCPRAPAGSRAHSRKCSSASPSGRPTSTTPSSSSRPRRVATPRFPSRSDRSGPPTGRPTRLDLFAAFRVFFAT